MILICFNLLVHLASVACQAFASYHQVVGFAELLRTSIAIKHQALRFSHSTAELQNIQSAGECEFFLEIMLAMAGTKIWKKFESTERLQWKMFKRGVILRFVTSAVGMERMMRGVSSIFFVLGGEGARQPLTSSFFSLLALVLSSQTNLEGAADRNWIARAWDAFFHVENFATHLVHAAKHDAKKRGYLKDAGCSWAVLAR